VKRRLRKKKHVAEFREFGFEVTAELRGGLSQAAFDALLDRWIDAIEARGLSFGGGGHKGGPLGGFVARSGRGSATDDDRASLSAFLEADPAIVKHEVGNLRDAWYGWD
jgi:uncharacterized protein YggL (DUF469 family)